MRKDSTVSIYEQNLDRTPANYVPLSPVSFLVRAARVYGPRIAVIHGERRYTYAQFLERARRLASALARAGVGKGDTVAIMAPNIPEMLEAHYAVPMLGAVLCSINIRLDAAAVAFILQHSEAKVVLVDGEFAASDGARAGAERAPASAWSTSTANTKHSSPPAIRTFPVRLPDDEWQAIALNYTSGTTGNPKGVVLHHRGAYLNACGNALTFGLSPRSVYLWTLPMFHCNGWTYTWAVTLAGGTHVCLRRVEPAPIFAAIAEHGVTHMCGAPVVLSMLIHAPEAARRAFPQTVQIATGGAAPPSTVIARMEAMGFAVTHLYGLTESYGPSTVCMWQPGLDDMPIEQKSAFMARQGVNTPTLEDAAVLDPATMAPVPADGATMGELMLRGNTVMKGYLKNPSASARGVCRWLVPYRRSRGDASRRLRGDQGPREGHHHLRRREHLSLEVEEVLYQHPDVMEAAVVARPDEKWGETPQAFVTLKPGASGVTEADIIAWCRTHLAHFKCPRFVTFGPLPKTSTGKIQKFELRERTRS